MPITYEIDAAKHRIHTRCVGDATLREVLLHFKSLTADPDTPPHLDVLLDLREMTNTPDSTQLHAAAGEVGNASSRIRFDHCAIVVASEAARGWAMVWAMFAQQSFGASNVFTSLPKAQAWLDASAAEVNPNPKETS